MTFFLSEPLAAPQNNVREDIENLDFLRVKYGTSYALTSKIGPINNSSRKTGQ